VRYWLLSIELDGATYRWASEPVSPLEGTSPIPHLGGLEVPEAFEESVDLLQVTAEPRSVPVTVYWLSPGVAELVAQGHDLASATGELAMWDDADDYARREVLVCGRLVEPQYGGLDEEVVFSLEEEIGIEELFPESRAVVSKETWPNADPTMLGRVYPQISGLPGHLTGSTSVVRDIPGSVAPVVDAASHVILAAGHTVNAATVTVLDSAGNSDTMNITHQADGLGRICAVVDITTSAVLTLGESEYSISWPTAGGRRATNGGELQYAGDVLCWALGLTSRRVDWPQVRSAALLLNWLVVAVDIEARTDPWDWARDHVLPLLPVSVVSSGRGLRLLPWRYGATSRSATRHLRAGAGCFRTELVTYDGDSSSVVNEVVVQWGMNAATGKYEQTSVVTGNPTSDLDHTTPGARLSHARYGARRVEVEADTVCSERAALQIGLWMLEALAEPRRIVTYYLSHYERFELGETVLLTDDEVSLDAAVAYVQGRVVSDLDEVFLTLLLG
jgi:hypothetical protein